MKKLLGVIAVAAFFAPGATFAQSYYGQQYGNNGLPAGYSYSYYGNYVQDPYGMPYYPEWGARYEPYPEYTWPTYQCGPLQSYTPCNDQYRPSNNYGYNSYPTSYNYPQQYYQPQYYPQQYGNQMYNQNYNFNNNVNNNNAVAIGYYGW
jgi:hypothetical protein